MEERSLRLQARTSRLLLETRDRVRDTVSKRDMPGRCFNCRSSCEGCYVVHEAEYVSTDKAVLATNGFAADGNNFVKRVRQRLEVSQLKSTREHKPS